jgi:putative membrane protein
LSGIAVGFLPAIGVSQAATMTQYIGGLGDARNFMMSLSGINIANEIFSLNSLYLMGNPRSGASVAIESIMPKPSLNDMMLLTGVIAFVSVIAAAATLCLGKRIPSILARLDYVKMSLAIMAFLVGMVFLSTGPYGLLVLFTSTSIGVLCARLGVKRSNCMGVLLLPSLLFFLGLNPFVLSLLGI